MAEKSSDTKYYEVDKNIGISDSLVALANENLFFCLFSLFIFAVPFFFPSPQPLTGSIVNAVLVLGALTLGGNKPYYLVFLPGLATIANGLLFGPFSIFIAYMLPFIWLGNAIIILAFKKFYVEAKHSFALVAVLAAFAKTALLYLSASLLFALAIIPRPILDAMGALQFFTALAGCALAFTAIKIYKRQSGNS